jgi:hypothetical protein
VLWPPKFYQYLKRREIFLAKKRHLNISILLTRRPIEKNTTRRTDIEMIKHFFV